MLIHILTDAATCNQPNLANYCVNYLKGTLPSRVVSLRKVHAAIFQRRYFFLLLMHSRVTDLVLWFVMDDQPLLVNFLSNDLGEPKTKKAAFCCMDG
jgi:hypothetical protein